MSRCLAVARSNPSWGPGRWGGRVARGVIKGGLFLCLPLLSGCQFLLFDPKGPIGEEQKWLIMASFAIMLIVMIPVFIMTVAFAIKYRATNRTSDYRPDWEHSSRIEWVVWSVPCAIIVTLGILTYLTSYSLDPRRPLVTDQSELVVHVVALDWKWLFIYPQYNIASVNEVAFAVNTPVKFLITSDSVMNSFFIPQLGSQIYAMAGMENPLHLIASEPGRYRGLSANYSGFGFSGMKFTATVVNDDAEFDQWVAQVRRSPEVLNDQRYAQLKHKTKDHPVEYFSMADPLMFNTIIQGYTGIQNGN